jgi:hypothetical protein
VQQFDLEFSRQTSTDKPTYAEREAKKQADWLAFGRKFGLLALLMLVLQLLTFGRIDQSLRGLTELSIKKA